MSKFTDLIANQTARKHYLCIVEVYQKAIFFEPPRYRTLYFSSHGFKTGPTDTPANTYFEPRMVEAYSFTRQMFSEGRSSGRTVPGYGDIQLNNTDGKLDFLKFCIVAGYRVQVFIGGDGFKFSEYGQVFNGTAQGFTWGDNVGIKLRDLSYLFDREFQTNLYAGATGAESSADLLNRRKPRAYGAVKCIDPLYLGLDSTGRPTYGLSDGPIVGLIGVSDKGVPLTVVSGTPTAGQCSINLTTAVLRLGAVPERLRVSFVGNRYLNAASASSASLTTGGKVFAITAGLPFIVGSRVRVAKVGTPSTQYMDGVVTSNNAVGQLGVTVDAVVGSGSALTDWSISPWGTAGGVMRAFAASMGVTAFNDAKIQNLDYNLATADGSSTGAVTPEGTIGVYFPEGGNGLEVLDIVSNGTGTYWGFDREGLFECNYVWRKTTDAPLANYTPPQILSFERLPTEGAAYSVSVRYGRNVNPLGPQDVAGSVSDPAVFTEEWRVETSINESIRTTQPLSKALTVDSVFFGKDAAILYQLRMFSYTSGTDYYKVSLKTAPLLRDIGDVVKLTTKRYYMQFGGFSCTIVDLTERADGTRFDTELGLWG